MRTEKDYAPEIEKAVEVLRKGGVILCPTDTVWGIGCDASNAEAVEKVYKIKKRAESKSFVLLASDMDMVARNVKEIPSVAIDLIEVNDRPMTIVYPGAICDRYHLADNVVAEDGSVGIRIPAMAFCRDLVAKLGHPMVSTSANVSGEGSPQVFEDVPQEIVDAVDYVVDPSLEVGSTGLSSQIIKVGMGSEVKIIRE